MSVTTHTFSEKLFERIEQTNSRVCLGIDPRPDAHPLTHPERFEGDPAQIARAVVYYFQGIIEATHDAVACYKPQSAFFEALGIPGLIALAQLIADIRARGIPVILDAKRGDMGSTAEAYAQSYLADGVFAADALTVNPYLGEEGLAPFVRQAVKAERGLFIVTKTSNSGGKDLQDMTLEGGQRVYEQVAALVTQLAEPHRGASGYAPIGAVVGATYPEALKALRDQLPYSVLLVPGYGAQGGNAESVAPAFDKNGLGAVVSSSRALTYSNEAEDFAQQTRARTLEMRDAINRELDR
jgi:orotidine-5'-phosphate decarboxylase